MVHDVSVNRLSVAIDGYLVTEWGSLLYQLGYMYNILVVITVLSI
jgi:hypothetical protein